RSPLNHMCQCRACSCSGANCSLVNCMLVGGGLPFIQAHCYRAGLVAVMTTVGGGMGGDGG
ncbi:Deoxyhypusine synthase regulatory subunit, partial [Dissostichus eleginoides]